MKKSRFSEEQIIGFIKEAETGMPVAELCRKHRFSDAGFYKWRTKFGGMDISESRRLRNANCPSGKLSELPLAIRTDGGPEFTSRAFLGWAHARGNEHLFVEQGKPTQNAYIKSLALCLRRLTPQLTK